MGEKTFLNATMFLRNQVYFYFFIFLRKKMIRFGVKSFQKAKK